MSLRVHGGEARGRRLKTPAGVRPTQGLIKEAMFNMLGDHVVDAVVLDLFAGSGALGIEALSRGARAVTFVERSQACVSILRQNLDALGYADRTRIVRGEVAGWLRNHPDDVAAASLILLDPPYGGTLLATALVEIGRSARRGALVMAEHAQDAQLPSLDRLRELRQRRHGDTGLTMLRAA